MIRKIIYKLLQFFSFLKGYIKFILDYLSYRKQQSLSLKRLPLKWSDRLPCLGDDTVSTGFDRHYVYHPAWAARIISKNKPEKHIDISSTLHFCSILSAFIPVEFYDYRPANLILSKFTAKHTDLLSLPFADNSVSSLSCMHVVEHIGLGRYGDPVDPEGDLKAINELIRVLAYEGNLLFVVPVGTPRIMFNGHRIYSFEQIVSYFSKLNLKEFTLIPDMVSDGGLVTAPPPDLIEKQSYGCGCFWFKKDGLSGIFRG